MFDSSTMVTAAKLRAPARSCWFVIAPLLALGGCVPYPIYKTLQPEATAIVRDTQGEPVVGASVTLVSSAYPYGRVMSRATQRSNAAGTVEFPSRKEWRTEVMMIHGAQVYFWNWCVEKEGFATLATKHNSADAFSTAAEFVLLEGQSTPCEAQRW